MAYRLKIPLVTVSCHEDLTSADLVGRFLFKDNLFSGDTLFPHGPGRTADPEAFRQIIASLETRIFVLPDNTRVYPGHGETTVLGREKEEYAVFSSGSHSSGLCGDVLWLSA